MKRIIFNLKKVWYDKIASGEKTVEYREFKYYWQNRFERLGIFYGGHGSRGKYKWIVGPQPDEIGGLLAVFRLGYSRKYPDIVRRITKIDIGPCPYEGWDGEYFRIFFEKETSPK